MQRLVGFTEREDRNRESDRSRDARKEYRGWYGLKRWKLLRDETLVRDQYTCQQTGEMLTGDGRKGDWNSPIVHHKKPHNGDPVLFWDPDNLESVTKLWHDGVAQSQERKEREDEYYPIDYV